MTQQGKSCPRFRESRAGRVVFPRFALRLFFLFMFDVEDRPPPISAELYLSAWATYGWVDG